MNIIPVFFIPAVIGVAVSIVALYRWPRWAIGGLIISKPIIDLLWDYTIIFNVNFPKIYAGFFAVAGLIYIILRRNEMLQCPISYAWIAFLGFNVVTTFCILDFFLLDRISYFLRILNGFIIMVLFYTTFDYGRDKVFTVCIFLAAAFTPLIFWLVQIFSSFPNTTVAGISNELTRIKGPYDDFLNFVFYALQALICSYAFFTLANDANKRENTNSTNTTIPTNAANRANKTMLFLTKSVLTLLILLSVVIIYKSYTKVGWLVVPIVSFLWFTLRKRFFTAIIVVVLTAMFFSINPFHDEAGSLFRKEIDVLILKNKKWDSDTLFMGRVRDWKGGMDGFNKQPIFNKLFGARKQLGNPENDYFRILWHNGILGFVAFLFLIGQTIFILLKRYFVYKDPIFLTAFLALVAYLLIGIGFYPMFYPAMQWFTWGMIGFVLSKDKTIA